MTETTDIQELPYRLYRAEFRAPSGSQHSAWFATEDLDTARASALRYAGEQGFRLLDLVELED